MKTEARKDRRMVIHEPLLFGSIAIIACILYFVIKAIA